MTETWLKDYIDDDNVSMGFIANGETGSIGEPEVLHLYLYYKRRRLYLCSAEDPVLYGSGSRRVYRRKGTSFDRVYVCL